MTDLVILVGFRGVGKTTIGQVLAKTLQYDFLDTDAEIARQRGKTIADIVESDGWPAFRRYEKEVIASLVSLSRTVVATGGGAVVHDGIWQVLQSNALIIWLTADEGVILERLAEDTVSSTQRPALEGKDSLGEVPILLKQRNPMYKQVAHHGIDTGTLAVDDVVSQICHLMNDSRV